MAPASIEHLFTCILSLFLCVLFKSYAHFCHLIKIWVLMDSGYKFFVKHIISNISAYLVVWVFIFLKLSYKEKFLNLMKFNLSISFTICALKNFAIPTFKSSVLSECHLHISHFCSKCNYLLTSRFSCHKIGFFSSLPPFLFSSIFLSKDFKVLCKTDTINKTDTMNTESE